MTDNDKTVTIFGTSKARPGDGIFETANEIGKALAKRSFTIANGGYGGTMLAAAKGASQAGGRIIGVTCSAFRKSSANEYITEEIVADSLIERLNKLVDLGDAYVVLAGGTGTLLELAQIWELKNKGFASADKPIIIAGEFWNGLIDLMSRMDPDCTKCVEVAKNAAEVIEFIDGSLSND
jgi:hypothetical protein